MDCDKCSRRHEASQVVEGYGADTPKVLVVAERPGTVEDLRGCPLVGPSGDIIRAEFEAIGFDPFDFYLDNAVKCMASWKPTAKEIKTCAEAHLLPYIQEKKPQFILALGTVALKALGIKGSISDVRGRLLEVDGMKVFPTYNPAYLMHLEDFNKQEQEAAIFHNDLMVFKGLVDGEDFKEPEFDYHLIRDYQDWRVLYAQLELQPVVAVDLETSHKSPFVEGARVLGMSFSWREGSGYFLPLYHKDISVSAAGARDQILDDLKGLLTRSKHCKLVFHNGQFDLLWMWHVLGIDPAPNGESLLHFDTMIASHTLRSDGHHGLKDLSTKYFADKAGYDYQLNTYLAERKLTKENMDQVPLEILYKYGCSDADCTFRLYNLFKPQIDAEYSDIYYELMLPASDLLMSITMNGMNVNKELLDNLISSYEQRIEELRVRMLEYPEVKKFSLASAEKVVKRLPKNRVADREVTLELATELLGEECSDVYVEEAGKWVGYWFAEIYRPFEVNFNSRDQLGEILVKYMGLKITNRTNGGKVATDEATMRSLLGQHPFVDDYMKYTELSKEYGTFLVAIRDEHLCPDGYIHPTFNLSSTRTYRLSSQNPNVQQLPSRGPIRRVFSPRNGCFISADLDQAELRVMASLANEPKMIEAFLSGKDIHAATASGLFGVPIDTVLEQHPDLHKSYRSLGKTMNFALIYGGDEYTIANKAEIPVEVSKTFIEAYFKEFPGVKDYMDRQEEFVRKHGYVLTPFGRKRYLPEITSEDPDQRRAAIRQAYNTPIQECASTIALLGAVRLGRLLSTLRVDAKIVNIVHDEIVVDTKWEDIEKVEELIRRAFDIELDFMRVPISIDIKGGMYWDKDDDSQFHMVKIKDLLELSANRRSE